MSAGMPLSRCIWRGFWGRYDVGDHHGVGCRCGEGLGLGLGEGCEDGDNGEDAKTHGESCFGDVTGLFGWKAGCLNRWISVWIVSAWLACWIE